MKTKIKLSIKQHNRIFENRKVKLLTKYEIIDDNQNRDIEMREYIRFPVRVLAIILSHFAIIVGGVPAMISLIKECLSNKDVGADTINRDWFYKKMEKEIENA